MPVPPAIAGLLRSASPDADLLARFVATRDEAAFTALVHRHGPTVWRVCRNLVRQPADAEDAYQATFLLLVRHAAKVRNPAAIGAWLYGVAVKVATRARTRRKHEPLTAEPAALEDLTVAEAEGLFHEELARLPEKFRDPLVMCCMDALARDEAAARLGVSVAAVKDRLERGRELLKANLLRRGVVVGVPLLAGWLAPAVVAGVPVFDFQTAASAVSTLAHEVGAMLFVTKWKAVAAAGMLAVAVGGFGLTLAVGGGQPGPHPGGAGEQPPVKARPPAEAKPEGKPMDEPFVIPPKPFRTGEAVSEGAKIAEQAKAFMSVIVSREKPEDALAHCLPGTVTADRVAAIRQSGLPSAGLSTHNVYDAYRTATFLTKPFEGVIEGKKAWAVLLLASVEVEPGVWKLHLAEVVDEAKLGERVKALEASWAKHPILSLRAELWSRQQMPGLVKVEAKEFDEFTAVFKPAGLSKELPATIAITPDGKCVYEVDGRPALGNNPAWPAAKFTHTLPADRLNGLVELLKATDWLAKDAEKGGPPLHSATYIVSLKRGGKPSAASFHHEQEPYKPLAAFLHALAQQESLLYQVDTVPDRHFRASARNTLDSYLRAELGEPFASKPLFPLDYTRFAAWATGVIRKPEGNSADDLRTAIRLVAHLRLESERKILTELTKHENSYVRRAAGDALDWMSPEAVKMARKLAEYRVKIPPAEGENEQNGKTYRGLDYLVSHLGGVATRLKATTRGEALVLFAHLHVEPNANVRFVAAFALNGIYKKYPDGYAAGLRFDVASPEHRQMIVDFQSALDASGK